MTEGTITTTVTFDDLIQACEDDIGPLREAFDELITLLETDDSLGDAERARLYQQAQLCNESAQRIQNRQHLLEQLRGEYDDGAFEIKMLSGQETIDIETGLRMEANRNDVDTEVLQVERKGRVVDTGTVDAPESVPRENGSPVPSQCPNALMFALFEQVEQLNNAGTTDFRAPGFDVEDDSPASVLSGTPTPSAKPSNGSLPTGEPSQPSGDSSATKPRPD